LLLIERDILPNTSDAVDTVNISPSSSLLSVLSASAQTALRLYDPPVYDYENGKGPEGWDTLMRKYGKAPTGPARAVFIAIHRWRDRLAREMDESVKQVSSAALSNFVLITDRFVIHSCPCCIRYVLPQHHIFKLSEHRPKDLAAFFSMISPVPPAVRDRSTELLETIKSAILDHTEEEEAAAGQVNEGKSVVPVDISLDISSVYVPGPAGVVLPDLWSLMSAQTGKRLTYELYPGYLIVVCYI
jgi:exosome complex exonuclease RRP6